MNRYRYLQSDSKNHPQQQQQQQQLSGMPNWQRVLPQRAQQSVLPPTTPAGCDGTAWLVQCATVPS